MATVSLNDLAPDQFYAVQVRAINAEGPSVWGPVYIFKTDKDLSKPAAVTGLVGAASGTTFVATWNKPTTNADGSSLLDLKDYEVTVSGETLLGPISQKFYVETERFELSLEQNKNIFAAYNDGNAMGTVDISVSARDRAGNVGTPATVTAGNPPPAAPTGILAEALPGAISLRWNPNDEADFSHYEIFVGSTSTVTKSAASRVYKGPGNSFVYRTLTVAPHWFIIRAIDVVNSGADAQVGPITPVDYFAVDTVAPAVPNPTLTTALDTTDPTRTSANITVTWPNVGGDLAGYKVRYSSSASGPYSYMDTAEDTTTLVIPNLNFNTTYYVQMQSYDFQANYSAYSTSKNITTPTETAPAIVTAASITAVGGLTSLTVSWTPSVTITVKEYDVEIDTVNTFNSADLRTATVGGKLATFTNLKMVTPNTGASYYIRVRPRTHSNVVAAWSVAPLTYNSGTAVSTKSDGVIPSAQPTGVSVIPMVQSLEVKWNAVTNADPVTYEVHAGLPGFTPDPTNKTTRIAETTGTSYLLRSLPGATTPLAYNTAYGVRVYAKDADGMATAAPAQVTGTTLFTTTADINFIARDIGSLKIYRQDTTPVAVSGETLKSGDLWYKSNENNNLYRYDGTTWVDIHDGDIDAAASAAAAAQSAANSAQSTADARITTFYQPAIPTSLAVGDLWVDTDDGNKSYRAAAKNATTIAAGGWVAIQDQAIQTALSNAATAQAAANAAQGTANNRNTTYYQTTMPTIPDPGTVFSVGDIWFDTDDGFRMYYYNGTTFTGTQWGGSAIADYSISGVKIIAGSVTAEKLTQVAFSDQALPNGSFEDLRVVGVDANQPAGMPSRWITDVGAGFVGATYVMDSTLARGGQYSLKMTNAANNGARAYNVDIIPVAGGETWYLGAQLAAAAATTGSAFDLSAYFYTNAGSFLSTSQLKLADATTSWQRIEAQIDVPATAAGMRIGLVLRSSATSRSINVDLAEIRRVTTQVMIRNGAVNADKVEVNSLETRNIKAGAITTDKIAVGTLGPILVPNGSFESVDQNGLPAGWAVGEGTGTYDRFFLATSPSGDHVLRINPGQVAVTSQAFPVKPGAFYNFRSKVMHTNGNGTYYVRIMYSTAAPAGGYETFTTRTGFQEIVAGAANTNITSWTQSDYTWTVPANVYWASISFYNWSASTGSLYVDDVQVNEQLVGTQIANGTITTGHITAGGISADVLTAGTVNADRITANSLDADKIKANTAFAQNLYVDSTIVMGPDSQGTIVNTSGTPEIRSSDYTSGGTNGWRLSRTGLDIQQGTVQARALVIQDSANLLPPEVAGAEFRTDAYTNGGLIAWGGAPGNGGATASYAKFGTQSIFFTKSDTTGTDTFFGFAKGFNSATDTNFALDQGTTYIVSMYIRIPAGGAGSIKNVYIRNQAGTDFLVNPTSASQVAYNTAITVGATWYRFQGFATTDAATTNGLLYLRVADAVATTYYFDGLQVERQIAGSSVASNWKPSGATSINGAMIKTGEIRSVNNLSSGPASGQPYWSISMTGDAVLNSAKVYGQLVVGSSTYNGTTTAIQSYNYIPSSQGWAIKADGSVEFASGNFRGSISGASGTFSGTINVANKFFVNSDGSFQAGNANWASAPFRVDGAGNFWATAANISGNISATSVSTTNTSIAANGTISSGGGNFSVDTSGSLYASRANLLGSLQVGNTSGGGIAIYLNANGIYYNSADSTSNFWVTSAGNLHANNGNFKGTIKSLSTIEAVNMTAATFNTANPWEYRGSLGNGIVDYGQLPALNFYSPNDPTPSGFSGHSHALYMYTRGGECRIHLDRNAGVGGQINFHTNNGTRMHITGSGINVDGGSDLNFGATTRQMINLYNLGYGIGVQSNTLYYRSEDAHVWYRGGGHSNTQNDGGGGDRNMRLDYYGGLYVANTIYSNNQAVAISSKRFKTDIEGLDGSYGLDLLKKFRPVRYNKTTIPENENPREYGFVAEEVYEIFPDAVKLDEEGIPHYMNYTAFIPVTVQAVKELEAQVAELRAELSRLTKK